MNRIIAIDFDGTITKNDNQYPVTGTVREEAIEKIKQLYDKGYTLVLWTCRTGRYMEEALSILEKHDVLRCFTAVNKDVVNRVQESRKIVADFYIDDTATMGEIDWNKIYDYITTYIK